MVVVVVVVVVAREVSLLWTAEVEREGKEWGLAYWQEPEQSPETLGATVHILAR